MTAVSEHLQLYNEFPLLLHNADYTVWAGYLSEEDPELRIKIFTPFYPTLKDMSFECSPFIKTCITPQINNLKNCKSLKSFLYSIIRIIKSDFAKEQTTDLLDPRFIRTTHSLLSELEEVIKEENILSIKENFRDIKVKYTDDNGCDHSLQFLIPTDYPKGLITILDADLPSEVLGELSKVSSIGSLYDLFKQSVDSLLPFWDMCKLLEEKAWVVDPANPQKKDTYRRILISDHLSVILNFHPLNVTSCPDVKFIGSMTAVTEAREKYLKNVEVYGWDEELDVAENIKQLLQVTKLPLKNILPEESDSTVENECYICFTSVADGEEPPAKWCNNSNCSSWYHYACLLQWLETVVSSVRLYDHISGPCPYCDEKLWCPLVINSK